MVDVNNKFNFFLNINNHIDSINKGSIDQRCSLLIVHSFQIINFCELILVYSLDLDVGEGAWSKNELVKSSEKGSHEGVCFGDINLSSVVQVKLSPCSWEELGHVGFHLCFGNLLGDKEDLSSSLLASILVENFLSGLDSSSIGDWDSVMVEDVVHDIVLIGSVVS
jgi:hypothetical protein